MNRTPFAALLILFLLAGPAAAASWAVVKDKSAITFSAVQTGSLTVTGKIPDFSATICFDERRLSETTATLVFSLANLDTGVPERNEILRSSYWLNTGDFPDATFALSALQRMGPNTYEAWGTLKIKGLSHEVSFPLFLDLVGERASGEFTIDRRDFNVGEGAWGETEKWVGFDVKIAFDLYAEPVGETCD